MSTGASCLDGTSRGGVLVKSSGQLGLSDWLRERRLELGLPQEPVVHQSLPRLLLKGGLPGLGLILAPFSLLLF